MRKVLILSLLPLTMLCACNKSGGAVDNRPTDVGTVEISKSERSVKVRGKKLELQAVKNVEFTDPSTYQDSLLNFDVGDSAFKLNYRVYNVRYMQIEFFEPISMARFEYLYIDFYQNESDESPVYTTGGKLNVDVHQIAGESRKVSIGNINNVSVDNASNTYLHVRFSGSNTGYKGIVSVTFGDLTVTSK